MSEEDPKAPSGAVPPIKRRVLRTAQTGVPAQSGPGAEGEAGAGAVAETRAQPSEAVAAPVPKPEPLPAVRIESRPDGQRFMDARAPRSRPIEPRRPPPGSQGSRPIEPRRPDRTRTRDLTDERPARREDARPRPGPERAGGERSHAEPSPREAPEPRHADTGARHQEQRAPEPRRPANKPNERSAALATRPPAAVAPVAAVAVAKEPDIASEIALAGAPPVREKQAKPKKDKPQTGKDALAQKARGAKHQRRKGGGPSAKDSARRPQSAATALATDAEQAPGAEHEADSDSDEAELEIPKRPSFWQRVVSVFKRSK